MFPIGTSTPDRCACVFGLLVDPDAGLSTIPLRPASAGSDPKYLVWSYKGKDHAWCANNGIRHAVLTAPSFQQHPSPVTVAPRNTQPGAFQLLNPKKTTVVRTGGGQHRMGLINFGNVKSGKSVTQTVSFKNAGKGPLSVIVRTYGIYPPMRVSGDPAELENIFLQPGESYKVNVRYSPTKKTSASQFLQIETNDPDAADQIILVEFKGFGK